MPIDLLVFGPHPDDVEIGVAFAEGVVVKEPLQRATLFPGPEGPWLRTS